MLGLGSKYAALVACVVTMFINFVACGSQLYKMSLDGDTPVRSANGSPSNPDVGNPNAPTYGLHAPGGWVALPIHFKVSNGLTASQRRGVLAAMAIWETAVGRKLFVLDGNDDRVGDSFKDLFTSLDDQTNGFYLDDNWSKMLVFEDGKWTPKLPIVLATTIWNTATYDNQMIDSADMRFNSNHYYIGDSITTQPVDSREVVDMQTLALHELGHFLGLAHISEMVDGDSIMTPKLFIGTGLTNRRLSKGDVDRIQKIYGCAGSSCDHEQVLASIEKLNQIDKVAANTTPKVTEQDTAH